jgi:acyl carrier protein
METDFDKFSLMVEELFEPQFNFDHKNLESWTSMQSLIVVCAIDEHYQVLLSHEELKQAKNLEDLYSILTQKLE